MAEEGEGAVYADSSFLISLYSPDTNSALAIATMQRPAGEIVITPLVEFELLNALRQRIFWRQIDTSDADGSMQKFETNLRSGAFRRVALPESLFERAREIAERTTATLGTRTIDLLHVAAALEVGAEYLYSFDERQRKLARTLRLKLNALV
jgi:predicted nucleic acid-binding protein